MFLDLTPLYYVYYASKAKAPSPTVPITKPIATINSPTTTDVAIDFAVSARPVLYVDIYSTNPATVFEDEYCILQAPYQKLPDTFFVHL
jgi:hypothetical protein